MALGPAGDNGTLPGPRPELTCLPKSDQVLMGIALLAAPVEERPHAKATATSPDRSDPRQVQVDLEAGPDIHQARRRGGIGLTTYYRWKSLPQNRPSSEQVRISALEDKGGRLDHLVAESALGRRMLQESSNEEPRPPPAAGARRRKACRR
jgi:hypothetical protein